MTQIARIFTDQRASASSAQSAFYCDTSAYDYKSHPCLNLLENKPQINADERRFVVPAICSSLLSIDTNQKNNHFFAPFAFFAVKNSATHIKNVQELPPNRLDDILNVKRE